MSKAQVEGLVLIGTDIGIQPFSLESADIDGAGHAGNLVPGTEYAVLDGPQADAWMSGEVILELQDEIRHAGAFALLFSYPETEIRSKTANSN